MWGFICYIFELFGFKVIGMIPSNKISDVYEYMSESGDKVDLRRSAMDVADFDELKKFIIGFCYGSDTLVAKELLNNQLKNGYKIIKLPNFRLTIGSLSYVKHGPMFIRDLSKRRLRKYLSKSMFGLIDLFGHDVAKEIKRVSLTPIGVDPMDQLQLGKFIDVTKDGEFSYINYDNIIKGYKQFLKKEINHALKRVDSQDGIHMTIGGIEDILTINGPIMSDVNLVDFSKSSNDSLVVKLNTPGGSTDVLMKLLDIIKSKKYDSIEIFLRSAYSAGCLLLCELIANNKNISVTICGEGEIMGHIRRAGLLDGHGFMPISSLCSLYTKPTYDNMEVYLKSGIFTNDEYGQILNGKDIYLKGEILKDRLKPYLVN